MVTDVWIQTFNTNDAINNIAQFVMLRNILDRLGPALQNTAFENLNNFIQQGKFNPCFSTGCFFNVSRVCGMDWLMVLSYYLWRSIHSFMTNFCFIMSGVFKLLFYLFYIMILARFLLNRKYNKKLIVSREPHIM